MAGIIFGRAMFGRPVVILAALAGCAREAAPPLPPPAAAAGTMGAVATELRAVVDPALRARIVARRPLVYGAPVAAELDRGDHVRAASGLAWLDDRLAIVQDDTSFVAFRDSRGSLTSLALPAAADGRRRFESRRGNKNDKLDLESCLVVDGRLLAFGSGALPVREVVVVVDGVTGPVRVVAAGPLYAALRAALVRDGAAWMKGAELNLEGAAVVGDRLRFFQRGNGAPSGAAVAVDAAVDVALAGFLAWLDGGPVPPVLGVTWYQLGVAGAVRYGFTDLHALADGRVLFLASAEDSPNAIDDGEVHGTRIGIIDDRGVRTTDLLDADGHIAAVKGEGLVSVPGEPGRVYVVLDLDDPDLPSELCTVELSGPW
jgi:hypothetical protein